MIPVTDQAFEKLALASKKTVVIWFFATWAGPCRMMQPGMESLSNELGKNVSILKIDCDENFMVPQRYDIRGVPTIIVMKDGEERERIVGAVSTESVREAIQKHVSETPETEENFESKEENEFLALVELDGKIKPVSLLPDGTYKFIDGTQQYHHLLYTYSLEGAVFKRAVEEFEEMINYKKSSEHDFQEFFERNPDFILNDDYKKAHSKIFLEREDVGTLIPDFVLEPFDTSSFCDLLEIKKPDAPVYVLKKNRIRFSSAVFEAVAQIREYSLYFEEKKHREKIKEMYGLETYKPRMFIILGRTGKVDPFEARKAGWGTQDIILKTYDQILERMKRKLS